MGSFTCLGTYEKNKTVNISHLYPVDKCLEFLPLMRETGEEDISTPTSSMKNTYHVLNQKMLGFFLKRLFSKDLH